MTEEILIPVTPNVECRDGKEIGVWMEGWLQGYKEAQGQYEAKETLYTGEDMLNFAKFIYEDDGSTINNDGAVKKETIEQFKQRLI